jgi:hypothetical protein
MKQIKLVFLNNSEILISQIEEVSADLGNPDCKLIEPYLLDKRDGILTPWLVEFTNQNTFMIHSEKILTIVDPKPTLIEKYQDLIK